MPRTLHEITIHEDDTTHRTFEWYWDDANKMIGLDEYETLNEDEQNEFLGNVQGWGRLPFGETPPRSQVNVENVAPIILAIKAKKWRFPVFHAQGTNTWIVCGPPYKKQGQQRDNRGDKCIERAVRQHKRYHKSIEKNDYYERDQ